MIVGQNYLNVDLATRGLYRVVSGDGIEYSGLHEYADIHAICYAVCIKEDTLYWEFDNILADVPDTYAVWLSFDDCCYHARPMDYVPDWYEIKVGTVKELNQWLHLIC